MRVPKIACCLAAAALLLTVPAISDAGKSDKSDSDKSDKSGKKKRLRCRTAGVFLTAFDTPALVDPLASWVATSSVGRCNSGFGQVGLQTIVEFSLPVLPFVPSSPSCIPGTSDPSTIYNKKGDSINFTATGEQCFLDANGVLLTVPLPGFCDGLDPDSAFFSILTRSPWCR